MSFTSILNKLLDTTFTHQRRTNTTDSLGDFSEVWNTLQTGIRGTTQPVSVKEANQLLQGKEYIDLQKAYTPQNLDNEPVNGDRIIDETTTIIYEIISVQRFRASKSGVGSGHHYKFITKIPRAPNS